jgi:class 3 adenylate cyclase/tetratricopeptide (TPR) repeat protein
MNTDQPESATRQATILRAVITGLDEMSKHNEPSRVNELVNKCYELINSVISLYGGTIDLFTGRETVAFFGIHYPVDKAPQKAVGAALDLVGKVDEMNREMELPVAIGIKAGINTGPVMIEKIGKDKQARDMVMGETVSIVSRICDIAENGQVLTGQETYELAKDRFEFLVLEPLPLKGSKKPLPIFEVKGRNKISSHAGVSSSRMISSAMVGRDKELKILEKHFMQLINGRGGVVNITGIAGIGKSRLMAEMKEKELMSKVVLLEGRALSNGKGLSFHPIIQIIKSWAGIKEDDSGDDALNKLQRSIHRVYREALDEIFPFIATMMGYRLEGKARERVKGIEGEALENLILKNLRDLLSRAASIRPVVIIIEDAHWCDLSSVIFLESLFKLVRKQQILFVIVFRPGHAETGERMRKFTAENLAGHHLEINVEPLAEQESNALIQNLLHKVNLPEEINRLIIDRAAGNPFFIEELIRSFIDEGLIEVKDDKFLLTENIKYANIPESIDKVLLSRIDRLDEKTKELLKTASVIGRNFYFKVLEEAAVAIEEVDNKLEYLKDVQLINERKKRDEVEFLFKHALAQQATYESIVEKTKKELHLKIAGSIEKVFAGRIHEFYGMLAHHYSRAGQPDKMEVYLVKAGEESMKSGASSEAADFLKQALEIYLQQNKTPDPQKVVELEEKLSNALYASGQYVEAVNYYDRIIAYYYKPVPKTELQRITGMVHNLVLINKILYLFKYIPDAKPGEIEYKLMKIISDKTNALTTIDPRRVFFESLYAARFIKKEQFGDYDATYFILVSTTFFFTGTFFSLAQKVMAWGEKFITEESVRGLLYGRYCQIMFAYYTGKKIEIPDEEKVFKYAIRIGNYWHVTVYYLYSGYNMTEWGNEKIALHLLKRIKDVYDIFENNYTIVQWHRLNGYCSIKFRKLEELLNTSEESINLALKTGNALTLLMIYCFRSMAFSFRKEPAEAKVNLVEAEKLIKDLKAPLALIHYLIAKGYIEIAGMTDHQVEPGAREALLKTTRDIIKHSQKARANLTEAYRLRAIAFWILNKPAGAVKNFKRSIQAGTSYGGNLELSRTYFEAGKFLRDPKNKKDRIQGMNGTECLLKAKTMFEQMKLQWDLAEYEKYMGNKAAY